MWESRVRAPPNPFYLKGLCEFSWVVLTNRFKQFIPIYIKIAGQGKTFSPNKTLINVYE